MKRAKQQWRAIDDPAVLKAFLTAYPNSAPAKQVRGRLRSLEPQTVFGRHRKLIAAVLLLLVLAGAGIWGLLASRGPPVHLGDDQVVCRGPSQVPTGFTTVTKGPTPLTLMSKEEYTDYLKDDEALTYDCASRCRTKQWCKAFVSRSGNCAMFEDLNPQRMSQMPSAVCWYWFRRN